MTSTMRQKGYRDMKKLIQERAQADFNRSCSNCRHSIHKRDRTCEKINGNLFCMDCARKIAVVEALKSVGL